MLAQEAQVLKILVKSENSELSGKTVLAVGLSINICGVVNWPPNMERIRKYLLGRLSFPWCVRGNFQVENASH